MAMKETVPPSIQRGMAGKEQLTRRYRRYGFGKREGRLALISFLLFCISAFGAYQWSQTHPQSSGSFYASNMAPTNQEGKSKPSAINELNKDHPPNDVWKLQLKESAGVFANNLFVVILSIIGGMVTVYALPVLVMLYNGVILGLTLGSFKQMDETANTFHTIVAGIVPHGIFEISAIVLASVIGVTLGKAWYRNLFKKPRSFTLKESVAQSLRFFFVFILPLLFMAAFVELFVTPYLLKM